MVSLLVVIYVVFISLGLPDSMFGVAWPVVHHEFGIAESFASLYSIITGVCSGGVSLFAGFFIRKFGTPKVTLVSVFLTAIGLLGISFSPNIVVMMIFTIILGWGAGAIDTGLNNYVSLHYEAKHMNWLHCFWGVGVTTSPLIMSVFLNDGSSWRNGYRVVALIQLTIAIIVLFYLKNWQKLDTNTKPILQNDSKDSEKVNIFKIKGLFPSIFSQGFYCSMEFLIGTWGASYLVNTQNMEADTAARWISLYYGGIMLGRLVSGFAAKHQSDNTLIRTGIRISLCGIILLFMPSDIISCPALLLIGFGFGPIFPCILHSVPARFGEKYSADLTGIHMGGAYTIGFGVQLLFGYIATDTTFKITPFVLTGLCLMLFTMNEIAIKKTKKTPDN